MKFLIDRCAGRKLAHWLQSQGHDVLESRALGPDPGDKALLEMAVEQGRTLVTIDSDFAQLVFLHRASHHGIVRLPDVPAQERIRLMETVLLKHLEALKSQAIITIRGQRIRISRAPIL